MNRKLSIIVVMTMVILASLVFELQASNDSKFRLGLQSTLFVGGISGIVEVANPWAMQGVIDLGVDAIAFRLLNRFHQENLWNAYLFGVLGVWSDDHRYWKNRDKRYRDDKVGVGVGIGLEYDWRALSPSLPPIGWNIELGASVIPDLHFNIDFGVH